MGSNQQSNEQRAPLEQRPVPKWAETLVRLLDRTMVVPGTKIPLGLDAIVGFIAPGAGDLVGGITTLTLVWLAFKLGVPKVVLLRMLLNVAIDALVGCVPVLGDAFDVYFRAGERNLELLHRHGSTARAKPNRWDYAIVSLALLIVLGLIALPIVIGVALVRAMLQLVGD